LLRRRADFSEKRIAKKNVLVTLGPMVGKKGLDVKKLTISLLHV
jgi:hypothetical protein